MKRVNTNSNTNHSMNHNTHQETVQNSRQQQSPVQMSTSMKRRYVVVFAEGTGYILVDSWQAGANAQTMLVKSQFTGEICVRRVSDLMQGSVRWNPIPPEVQNAVNSFHIPRLLSHQTYPDPRPPEYGEYLNYVSTWQLCNGPQIYEIQELMVDDKQLRVPEAVLWNLLKTGLETILECSSEGIVHTDLHAGNILLHWDDNSPLPSFFVVDFGGSEKYPPIHAWDVRQPWTAYSEADIVNGKISDAEFGQLDIWYNTLFNDMLMLIQHIHVLMSGPKTRFQIQQSGRVRDPERHLFAGLARSNQGLSGYSPQLIRVIAAWCNIMYACRDQPDLCAKYLSILMAEIRMYAGPYCHNLLRSGARGFQSTNWMRGPEIPDRILTFKDPQILFDVGPPELGDERAENDDNFGPANPRIVLELSDLLKLRQGQYQVGEIMFDESTGEWQPVRLVKSMDEIDLPLSPDTERQNPFDNTDDHSDFVNIPWVANAAYTGTDPSYPEQPMYNNGSVNPAVAQPPPDWLHNPFLTQDQLETIPSMQPIPDSVWLIYTSTFDLGIGEGEGNDQGEDANTAQGGDDNDDASDENGPIYIKQEEDDGHEVLARAPAHV